jgi:hypothetical protein
LPAAFKRDASHLLGVTSSPSGRAERTAAWHASAADSHVESDGAAGTQPVGLSYFAVNLRLALLLQSGWTDGPFVASLPEQPRSDFSFLPIALIFAPLHLSARAGPAPAAMRRATLSTIGRVRMSSLPRCGA